MVNGIKLEGVIKHHGEYHIVMRARSEDMLVYKHAIATIVRKTVQKEERV
jgi:RNA chaperone Hfq